MPKKLHMDFQAGFRLCRVHAKVTMDNDMFDLVDRLCTVTGMIMEDHHLSAITTSKLDVTAKAECLADLAGTGHIYPHRGRNLCKSFSRA